MGYQVIEEFLNFENDYKLYYKHIKGFHFWNYNRFFIFNKIVNRDNAYSKLPNYKTTKLCSKQNILNWLENYVFRNPLCSILHKDILVLNSPRRVQKGKYYICPYTEMILKKIKYSYSVIEAPYNRMHYKPVDTKNLWYLDGINSLIQFELSYKSKINLSKHTQAEIKHIVGLINSKFKINLSYTEFIRDITNQINYYIILKKYVRLILRRIQPKCIIEINSYNFTNMVFNEVAKELGIKTIELQHGVMGKYNISYNYYGSPKLKSFVDNVFVFGEYWKNNTRFPISKKNIYVTGYPEFEKEMKREKVKGNNIKKSIIFISDALYGQEFSNLAIELYEKINHTKYDIIFKLHPLEYNMSKRIYSKLYRTGIKVIDNNSHDIYYYLKNSDYQVGINSTAIYEGIGLRVKTFIVNWKGSEVVEALVNSKYSYLINSVNELIDYLERDQEGKIQWNTNIKIFWENDSLKKINSYIEEIINQ